MGWIYHFQSSVKFIEAEWRIYASMNYDNIGSDDGLSPGRCQAIIWANICLFSIRTLGTNFCEILIVIQIFSLKKVHVKIFHAKWWLFYIGFNVLSKVAVQ